MSLGKRHPPELHTRALEMMRDGHSSAEISRTLGLPRGTVSSWRLAAGFEPAQVQAYAPEIRAQARRLYLDGIGQNTIAARLGVSRSAVGAWLKGLPAHQRGKTIRKYSLSDVRYVLDRLEDGETITAVSADLQIPESIIRGWADEAEIQRRARRDPRERYHIADPVRALALSGAWR